MNCSFGFNKRNILDVVIIGAGFAGIGVGIKLKMKSNESFVILEKSTELGGTWRDNTYPGCACDIPSLLYSYSFEPNPEWSRAFSPQKEILTYLKGCAKKYGMMDKIRFNSKVVDANFDQQTGTWAINCTDGHQVKAKMLISAAGPFNEAFIPNIKGKESFQGQSFHSLHWNHNYDLTGKKVAIIGTGASAIQIIPEIVDKVDQLYIFQRTAPYIAPKPDAENSEKTKNRFRKYPWYQRFWRQVVYWFLENGGRALYSDNRMRTKRKKIALDHLAAQIPDTELRKKLTPNYEFGCKRVLISDEYYPALLQENVEVINEGAAEITASSIRTKSGEIREVDAIIYATGFYTTKFPNLFKINGLSGKNLFDRFNEEGPEAYLGMAVTDYSNMMIMVGPNSGLGHNSIIYMMESQISYILDYLKHLKRQKNPAAYFNLKSQIQKDFNEDIQAKLSKMVWSDGNCSSYYLQNQNSKNTSIWPGSTVTYRRKTKGIKLSDYEVLVPDGKTSPKRIASNTKQNHLIWLLKFLSVILILLFACIPIFLLGHGYYRSLLPTFSQQKSKFTYTTESITDQAIISPETHPSFAEEANGLAMPGFLYRSKNGLSNFELRRKWLFDTNIRHSAVYLSGKQFSVFYTRAGEQNIGITKLNQIVKS